MTERQNEMFDEDKFKSDLEVINGKIRHRCEQLRDYLSEAEGYNVLLKMGPKIITDVFFRCQRSDLSYQNLNLYCQQAEELSGVFSRAASTVKYIQELEAEKAAIEQTLVNDFNWQRNGSNVIVRPQRTRNEPEPMPNMTGPITVAINTTDDMDDLESVAEVTQ